MEKSDYIRFKKEKVDDLGMPGKIKIQYRDLLENNEVAIEVRDSGVIIRSTGIKSEHELQEFAYFLSKAWEDHRAMKRQIRKNLMTN